VHFFYILIVLVTVTVSCETTQFEQPVISVTVAQYETEAQSLLELVAAARIKPELRSEYIPTIQYESQRLVRMGASLAEQYVKKDGRCEEYLQAALQLQKKLGQISLRELEKDYHADGRLKSYGGSSVVGCQHVKSLLVHPATVVALSSLESTSNSDFDRMSDEITEVISHSHYVTM